MPNSLLFRLVAPPKPFYSPGGIEHPALSGEKWMTLAAQFHLEQLLGRTGGEGITTGADYLGIGKVLGMNLFFHIF